MKLATYNDVIELMQGHVSRKCLKKIARLYPDVSIRTLGSIYSQEYQKRMKKCHHKFYTAKAKDRLYQRYSEAVRETHEKPVLLQISNEIGLSPSLLARLILEHHLTVTSFDGETVPRTVVTQMIKDTTLIEDSMLAQEVQSCILADDVYGHLVDSIKHSIGHEHEFLLYSKLKERNIAYLDEDQMRARGYDKTPDVKLEVPIAVDGHVVNWVESKASFGDGDSHRQYLKEQFWSYWNRFGPGLVIYWFGFIEELDVNRDKGIVLMDHFPEVIVTMRPSALASR